MILPSRFIILEAPAMPAVVDTSYQYHNVLVKVENGPIEEGGI